MDLEKKYLNQFILNLCENNLAKAHKDLRSIVVEKMQKRIKDSEDKDKKCKKSKKDGSGKKSGLPPWLNKDNKKDKK